MGCIESPPQVNPQSLQTQRVHLKFRHSSCFISIGRYFLRDAHLLHYRNTCIRLLRVDIRLTTAYYPSRNGRALHTFLKH